MIIQNIWFYVFVFLLLPYTTSTLVENGTTPGWCMENEREALLVFKQGFVDDYGLLSSWGREKYQRDCCKWRGVKCSNSTGRVVTLDLRNPFLLANNSAFGQPLSGKLSPSLIDLKHLRYLDLSFNDFQGSRIPKFIGLLSRLQYLSLQGSNFFGAIPHEIGNLTNLRSLYLGEGFTTLSVNNLHWLSNLRVLQKLHLFSIDLGHIKWLQSINELPFLSELHLVSCNLEGIISLSLLSTNISSIPLTVIDLSDNNIISSSVFNWLFNLSHTLVHVDISKNPLGGSIPDTFGNMMVSLESFFLSNCSVEGEIPKSFMNLSRLQFLDLQTNRITGSLPDITKFSSLRDLRLYNNKLSGSFPKSFGQTCVLEFLGLSHNELNGSFPELGLFPLLRKLHLNGNKLKGLVPESIGQLSNLKEISLSFNQLSLDFTSDWTPLFNLDIIELANCRLGPRFPQWLRSQNKFSCLDISNSRINDSAPHWFWDLSPKLDYLNISDNHIYGRIPYLSLKFDQFPAIDFRANRFMGPIPLLPSSVSLLNLSKNNFSGSIDVLCTMLEFLQSLDLSYNLLSGQLPDCWVNAKYLHILNLSNNNLSGNIPLSFGFLNHIRMMSLSNNHLTGILPSSLKNCTSLQIIDMSKNNLSGKIPSWIGTHLTRLVVVTFRNNKLSGTIPTTICNLSRTQVLDFSLNIISGTIPKCLNELDSFIRTRYQGMTLSFQFEMEEANHRYGQWYRFHQEEYVAGALLQWKGAMSEYRSTLGLLKCIDLSSNKLVGSIPQELASLEELRSLNLSRNNLTGDIMQNVGQMKMLEVLDLSKNHLSGQLPISLARLNFLNVFNLSDNGFSGKIPLGTQLQSFNASSYNGNPKLCGLPLLNMCSGEDVGSPSFPPFTNHGKDDNDDDMLVNVGFYVSIVLGFAIGFWGFVGPLFLRISWRKSYFKFLEKLQDWVLLSIAVNMGRLQRKFNL